MFFPAEQVERAGRTGKTDKRVDADRVKLHFAGRRTGDHAGNSRSGSLSGEYTSRDLVFLRAGMSVGAL